MKDVILGSKDFKIIPNNFKSAGSFNIINVDDEKIEAELLLISEDEKEDYTEGSSVEVFGVNSAGLVYFETKILKIDGFHITLKMMQDYSIIQRREYSRVDFEHGKVVFKDKASDFIKEILDISAGGIKILTTEALELDKHYAIEIFLANNMRIECSMQPIRIQETKTETGNKYIISGKFVDLENVDRIVLVQYAFKIKMEQQNREDE